MPSFDIVSKTEIAEVDNALDGVTRDIGQRYDFKGSRCSIERKENELTLLADDDLKMKQMHELLVVHFTRRKLDPGALITASRRRRPATASGRSITVKQGIDKDLAKQITKAIKDSKMKVQASIQGDELRVTGKKIDDLQAAIAMVKGLKIEQPLQYINFRD